MASRPRLVRGPGLSADGVYVGFVAGYAFAQFAELRHLVVKLFETAGDIGLEAVKACALGVETLLNGVEAFVDVPVLGVEALPDGIEPFVDVLVLGIEAPCHICPEISDALVCDVEAPVDGVETLVNGIKDREFGKSAQKTEDDAEDTNGGRVVFEPVPQPWHGFSPSCVYRGVYHRAGVGWTPGAS